MDQECDSMNIIAITDNHNARTSIWGMVSQHYPNPIVILIVSFEWMKGDVLIPSRCVDLEVEHSSCVYRRRHGHQLYQGMNHDYPQAVIISRK